MENAFYFSSTLELGSAFYLNLNLCQKNPHPLKTKLPANTTKSRKIGLGFVWGVFQWASKEFLEKTLERNKKHPTSKKNWKRDKTQVNTSTHQKKTEFRNGKLGTGFKAKFKGYSAEEIHEQKVVRGNSECLVLPEKGLSLQVEDN